MNRNGGKCSITRQTGTAPHAKFKWVDVHNVFGLSSPVFGLNRFSRLSPHSCGPMTEATNPRCSPVTPRFVGLSAPKRGRLRSSARWYKKKIILHLKSISVCAPLHARASQPHPQQPQAQQCAHVVEWARWPGGGAVAQVRVAAVDAHAGQFLLLAVSGRGTTAGQDDAQGRCEGQRREAVSQSVSQSEKRRVTSSCLAQQGAENAQVSSR